MVKKDCASVSSGLAHLKIIERHNCEQIETLNYSQAFVDEVILLHRSADFYLTTAFHEIISHCNASSVVKDALKG